MVGGQKALDDLAAWVGQRLIQCPETIFDGLQTAPQAFVDIFKGNANVGKLLVKVAEPDANIG